MSYNDDIVKKYQQGQTGKETEKTITPAEKQRGQELIKKQVEQNKELGNQEKHGASMKAHNMTTDGKNLNANDIPSRSNIQAPKEDDSTKERYKAIEKPKDYQQAATQIETDLKAKGINKTEKILTEHGRPSIGKSYDNDKGIERH